MAKKGKLTFKYISCSYLSLQYSVLPLQHCHLNTSHVLIYRDADGDAYLLQEFKYISCSYLSYPTSCNFALQNPFKYISCSY